MEMLVRTTRCLARELLVRMTTELIILVLCLKPQVPFHLPVVKVHFVM